MIAQHTPGPWEIWPAENSVVITESLGRHIAAIPLATHEWKENARLIAAAPELLEALEELEALGSLELPQRRDAALLKAKAAIAKAKGDA